MVDIRTPHEIERAKRHKQICDWWRKNYDPGRGSKNRFLTVASAEFGMTAMGIKNVLITNNLYGTD